MASITIRQLGDRTKQRLRLRAAMNGRSMEDEARDILRGALAPKAEETGNLMDVVRRWLKPEDGADLEGLPRDSIRRPPSFE